VNIVAITTVKNEADILPKTISHLQGEGITSFVISVDRTSTDSTWDYLLTAVSPVLRSEIPFHQADEMTRLAHIAYHLGADWVLPFDADEFWVGTDGQTIHNIIEALPPEISTIYAAMYQHVTFEERHPNQKPMGKVMFRPNPNMLIEWGNHNVANIPGEDIHGIIQIRELQYQSKPHFFAKVEKARELFASWDVPRAFGHHMRRLADMDDVALDQEWDKMLTVETIVDPIPYKGDKDREGLW